MTKFIQKNGELFVQKEEKVDVSLFKLQLIDRKDRIVKTIEQLENELIEVDNDIKELDKI